MDDWADPVSDPVSDRSFREALLDALDGRPRDARPRPEGFLWIASALLLGTHLLLVLAVFVNVIGGLGPVNPSRILWAALGMDLVGVALLGWIVWDSAGRVEGPVRLIRRIAALLLFLWVGLTAFWRFALPAAVGTDIQELFVDFLTGPADFPARFREDLTAMYQIFGLWIAAAAVFAAAHVLLAIVRRTAAPDDWARGLPVYAWIRAPWRSRSTSRRALSASRTLQWRFCFPDSRRTRERSALKYVPSVFPLARVTRVS